MHAKKLISGFLLGLFLILFLPGCGDTPPKIQFTIPDGQVLPPDQETVMITGNITPGSNPVRSVKVGGSSVSVASEGSFSYAHTLNASGDEIFSTCTFELQDTKLIKNKERITFSRGVAAVPAYGSIVEHAVNVLLNESFIDVMAGAAENVINSDYQSELIYDVSGLFPLKSDIWVPCGFGYECKIGWVVIDNDYDVGGSKQGIIEVGETDVKHIDVLDDQNIEVDVEMKDLFIQGYLDLGILGKIAFQLDSEGLTIEDLKVKLYINERNYITARVDHSDVPPDLAESFGLKVFGAIDIPDGLIDLIITMVFTLFDEISLPFLSVDDLSMTMYGISGSVWFPEPDLYTTDDEEINIGQLSVSAAPEEDNPANPGLDHFYSTPDDGLPDLYFNDISDNQNLVVGINDDTLNMAFFAGIQAGLLNEFDVTSLFGEAAKQYVFMPEILVTLKAPPIADWSESMVTECDGGSCTAGKYMVRNLIIEINDILFPNSSIRMSIDVDVAMKLKASNDGKSIEAVMDKNESDFTFSYLYVNNVDLKPLAALAEDIVLYVMDTVLKSMVKIKLPVVELYDADIQPHIYSVEVGENNMILRLGASLPN